jgi:hypothetical protein
MSLVKSKQRVADHGEVFTPPWMVEAMLDLVKGETERIDSRFLEPACGDGNFLTKILQRKLAAVEVKYGKSEFERQQYSLLALMCVYGIELLADNVADCRRNLLEIFAEYLHLAPDHELYRAASYVLSQNLIHGDALTMRAWDGSPITFAEWGYLWKGRFQRRDFRLDTLTQSSAFSAEDSLFAKVGKHEIFTPTKSYLPMTIGELAALAQEATPVNPPAAAPTEHPEKSPTPAPTCQPMNPSSSAPTEHPEKSPAATPTCQPMNPSSSAPTGHPEKAQGNALGHKPPTFSSPERA